MEAALHAFIISIVRTLGNDVIWPRSLTESGVPSTQSFGNFDSTMPQAKFVLGPVVHLVNSGAG
jgi:hypothetical protein